MLDKVAVLGIIRHILTFGGGWIVARGLLDEATWVELSGAIITVIGVVWSVMEKKSRPE